MDSVPPVSTTMQCVTCLMVQFFVVYTALALARSARLLWPRAPAGLAILNVLQGATKTVDYAPMLSVLYAATRLRAITLTRGDPEGYGLRMAWCEVAMVVSTVSVALGTMLQLIGGAF